MKLLISLLPSLISTFTFIIPKQRSLQYCTNTYKPSKRLTKLYASNDEEDVTKIKEILLQSNPYEILSVSKTADKKEIKRAYRRMAMKYHPDVISSKVDKKLANDVFIKINTAYESLLDGTAKTTTTSKSTSSNEYTPPHRRKSSSYNTNFDWDEYMNNYQKEEEEYTSDGDSFSAIFSDLIQEVVVGASTSGGKGIFNDFVEFLEKSVDGISSGNYDSDPALNDLLYNGSIQDVKNELDDTELVLQQLQTKLNDINNEINSLEGREASSSFRQSLEMEEEKAELFARKKVMMDYISKGQNRLVKLQLRYKELRNGDYSSSYSSTYSSSTQDRSYTNEPSSSTKNEQSTSSAGGSSTNTSSSSSSSSSTDNSWKRQGFGSSGRGRGRGRSRSTTTSSSTSSTTSSTNTKTNASYNSNPTQSPSYTNKSYSQPSSSSTSLTNNSIPPHRRTTTSTSYAKQAMEDKKRLRQLQIEEEFEKLKNEINKK